MNNNNNCPCDGSILSVRGSVVDAHFSRDLPHIHEILYANDKKIVLEVLAQLNTETVRAIALTPTQGLARGMLVKSSGNPLVAPIGKNIISRMFNVFGNRNDPQHDRPSQGCQYILWYRRTL